MVGHVIIASRRARTRTHDAGEEELLEEDESVTHEWSASVFASGFRVEVGTIVHCRYNCRYNCRSRERVMEVS